MSDKSSSDDEELLELRLAALNSMKNKRAEPSLCARQREVNRNYIQRQVYRSRENLVSERRNVGGSQNIRDRSNLIYITPRSSNENVVNKDVAKNKKGPARFSRCESRNSTSSEDSDLDTEKFAASPKATMSEDQGKPENNSKNSKLSLGVISVSDDEQNNNIELCSDHKDDDVLKLDISSESSINSSVKKSSGSQFAVSNTRTPSDKMCGSDNVTLKENIDSNSSGSVRQILHSVKLPSVVSTDFSQSENPECVQDKQPRYSDDLSQNPSASYLLKMLHNKTDLQSLNKRKRSKSLDSVVLIDSTQAAERKTDDPRYSHLSRDSSSHVQSPEVSKCKSDSEDSCLFIGSFTPGGMPQKSGAEHSSSTVYGRWDRSTPRSPHKSRAEHSSSTIYGWWDRSTPRSPHKSRAKLSEHRDHRSPRISPPKSRAEHAGCKNCSCKMHHDHHVSRSPQKSRAEHSKHRHHCTSQRSSQKSRAKHRDSWAPDKSKVRSRRKRQYYYSSSSSAENYEKKRHSDRSLSCRRDCCAGYQSSSSTESDVSSVSSYEEYKMSQKTVSTAKQSGRNEDNLGAKHKDYRVHKKKWHKEESAQSRNFHSKSDFRKKPAVHLKACPRELICSHDSGGLMYAGMQGNPPIHSNLGPYPMFWSLDPPRRSEERSSSSSSSSSEVSSGRCVKRGDGKRRKDHLRR